MIGKRDEATWVTFKRLWLYIRRYKIFLLIATVALILNALSDTYLVSLLKPLLDEGLNSADSHFFKILPLIITGVILVRGVSAFTSSYCLSWVSGYVVMQIRRSVFNKLMHMPVKFFDQEPTGSLLSRITYDSDQVASAASRVIVSLIREGTSILGLLLLMFWNSWRLSSVLLIVAPLVAWAGHTVSKRFRHISKNMQSTMGEVTSSTEQMLRGHKVVLSYGGYAVEKKRFDDVSNKMRQQTMKLVVAQSAASPVIQMIASTAVISVLYLASIDLIREQLTPGTFTLIFSAMLGLMRPLKALTSLFSDFQRGMAAGQTLFGLIDLEAEKDTGVIEKLGHGDISVSNVTFTHEGKKKPTLKNISFNLPKGKTVALVGRSGSGKSTIANLFMRFYDVDRGKITLDGENIENYTLSSLRKHFSVVSQNAYLFNETIANNIAYAVNEEYCREEIEKAATSAHAMDFIQDMPNGLDTLIGENGNHLSVGQRQRIAIARALLRNAPVLILDEATSALDTESERAIQSVFEELQKDRVVLVIAHRLSTVKSADEILFIDEGRVLERGKHSDLVQAGGPYSRLYKTQFGGSC